MRGWFKAVLGFGMLILSFYLLSLNGASPQEPLLGDLLAKGWQSESQNRIGEAASAYSQAINLQRESPLLRIKYAEMLILLNRPDEVARQLAQALEILSKDSKAPVDLKRYICDLLMGRLPAELRQRRTQLGYDYEGWLSPSPFATLTTDTQKRILQLVPKEWLFPTKANEAWFLLSTGEKEQGLKLLREATMEGDATSAIHALMSRFAMREEQIQIARSWLRDAEQTVNPFLWLVSLKLLWQTQQMDAFRASFPKALHALEDQPALLYELANLCEKMKWEEGHKQVLALLPPSLKPTVTVANISDKFHRALDEGDLTKVKALIRVLTDFPNNFLSIVLSANSIRKMLGHKWHDFVVELIQLDLVPELPYDTKQVLLYDATFNPSLFSHWMRLFMSKPVGTPHETAVNLLEITAGDINEHEPERAIWLLEQGLLIFPNEPRLLRPLALAYERAGYPNRAIEILKELVKRYAEAGIINSNLLSQLWDIAFRYKQLPELMDWLKGQRKDLPLGYFVAIARLWMQHNKPQEALQWLDEAFAIARKRGWLKDAEIHALIYRLLRSPNPQDFKQALKLQAEVERTAGLFHPDTYELRLNCLLSLGKKDEERKVWEEATRLYPHHPFTERVRGRAQIAITDWEGEFKRQVERWQKLSAPNYSSLVHLAYATVKAGKEKEAKGIADKLMAAHPEWKEGYLLAVEFFSHRIDALVPFARWVYNIAPKLQFIAWRYAVDSIGAAIEMIGENSLAGVFVLASVLLLPDLEGERLDEALQLVELNANKWWSSLTPEDREKLKLVLTKERVNPYSLNWLETRTYLVGFSGGEELRQWLESLKRSQTQSAHLLICQLKQQLPKLDREQVRNLVAQLERADWNDANWCPLVTPLAGMELPKQIAQKGFREEAVALLKIALKHAPDEQKAKLMAQLTELTGKLPEGPKGIEALNGKAWLLHAQAAWQAQRLDEAKRAALKALGSELPLKDQAEALKILAGIDPELALDQISQRFSYFLVREPNTDSPLHLLMLADVLYQIAERHKELATKVLPLLERTCEFSEGMKIDGFSKTALVHFWAGNNLRGIALLFEPLDRGKVQWNLSKIMGIMVRADVPENARKQIAEHLKSYLQNRKVSLSLLADELGNVRELNLLGSFNPQTRRLLFEVSTDSLVELAQILQQRLDSAEGIVPREFLEKTLWKVKGFAVIKKPFSQERLLPDEVVEAWWQLFETAFHKAVKTSGDANSLKRWLREFWTEQPDTYFNQTIWFERLKKLTE